MDTLSHDAVTRPATAEDAGLVHALYLATPAYFDIISIPVPTADEVRTDLETAARDPRRHTEIVLLPAVDGGGDDRARADAVEEDAGRPHAADRDPVPRDPVTGDPVTGDPVTGETVSGDTVTGDTLNRDPVARDPVTGRVVVGYLDYKLDYPEKADATVNLLLVHGGLQSRGIGRRCVADLETRLRGRASRVLASIYGQNPRAKRFWQSLGYHFAIDAKPILDWYAKELTET